MLQEQSKIIHNLYQNKVDVIEFTDPYDEIISELIKEVYGEEGYNWWSWYCFESDFGKKDWSGKYITSDGKLVEKPKAKARFGAFDENGKPICYSHKSTWNYLEGIRKSNNLINEKRSTKVN